MAGPVVSAFHPPRGLTSRPSPKGCVKRKEAPGGPEASQESRSPLEGLSGHPFLGLTGHGEQGLQGLQVMEPERGAVTPGAGLVLERAGKGRREEGTLLARVLPDRRLDAAAAGRLAGGSRSADAGGDQNMKHSSTSNREMSSEKTAGTFVPSDAITPLFLLGNPRELRLTTWRGSCDAVRRLARNHGQLANNSRKM